MKKTKISNEVFDTLVDRAINNNVSAWELIKTPEEASVVRTYRSASDKVARGFLAAAHQAYSNYIECLKNNIDYLKLLLEYRKLQTCADFYINESNEATKVLTEYTNYLMSGHFLDAFVFCKERSEEDLFYHQ